MNLRITITGLLIGVVAGRCPDGWINFADSCYLFGHDDLEFTDAAKFCERLEGHVVNVESEAENMFLKGFLSTLKAPKHWIGITDQVMEGIWRLYPSEHSAPFTDWDTGEPNAHDGGNCAAYFENHSYKWVDEPCTSRTFRAICEMELGPTECEPVIGK